jgi:DNA-binding response OmpR family regulator
MIDDGQPGRRTVLLIDDNSATLDQTRSALELAGFRVLTRDRASGALVAILRDCPDLILLDISMASWTASILSDIMGRSRKVRGTSVVFYASLPSNVLRMKVLAHGAHGYIQRTNVQVDLVRQVRAFLSAAGSATHGLGSPSDGALSSGGMRAALAIQDRNASLPLSSSSLAIPARNSTLPESGAAPVSEGSPAQRASGTVRVLLPTVLFLDDDLQVLTGYRRALSSEELTGEYLTSADQAVRRIAADKPPDVVITELVLPGMNGIELYRRAVELDATWRHRFVFVTGATTLAYVADFLRRVGDRALSKPVDMRALREAIRYAATGARIFRKQGSSA